MLWFAVRREWRRLAVALAATVAIVAVSYLVTPDLWVDWIRWLWRYSIAPTSPTAYPLPRLVAAVALLVWGGLTDRRWTVPIAVMLAIPVLWSAGLSILVALVPLLRPVFAAWLRPAAAARTMFAAAPGVATLA